MPPVLRAFRQGLSETGYVEGRNVSDRISLGGGRHDRLPALAADLVRRQVTVIVRASTPAALAAKAATSDDPDRLQDRQRPGAARPCREPEPAGRQHHGRDQLNVELAPKRLELLHELVPAATTIALLVNPTNPTCRDRLARASQAAAATLGLQLHILHASTERDFDAVFATLAQAAGRRARDRHRSILQQPQRAARRAGAPPRGARDLRVSRVRRGRRPDELRRQHYGSYHLAGIYTGRILKGEKPADLPVQQSTKVELIINLKTAKALGLSVPLALLARADEVIE